MGEQRMAHDIEPQRRNDVSGMLGRTIKGIADGFAGIAASDRKEWALSVGHLFQRLRGGQFLNTLKGEWDLYKAKGKISDEFEQSDENWDCLQELLDCLDKDVPDSKRFEAMKNLYLNIAVHAGSPKSDFLSQQLMRVCRRLSSGELIVLLTVYRTSDSKRQGAKYQHYGAENWLVVITNRSGMPRELVETYEEALMEKRLLSPRIHGDRSGVVLGDYFRLTDFAVTLCDWIAKPPE